MATRTTYLVVDDLDGSAEGVTTRRFTVDGIDYEIDLSPANSTGFDQALGPYLSAARRLAGTGKPHRRRKAAGGNR